MNEARDLVDARRAAGKLHAVVQNRRYLASVRRIARFLRTGAIGDVTSVHADFFLAPHFGGFREEMDHVLLLDMAIHGFDAMRAMTGLKRRRASTAREWNPRTPGIATAPRPPRSSISRTARVFTYRGSWCADGLGTSWECEWRIVGAKGTLTWDGRDSLHAEIGGGPRKRSVRRPDAARRAAARSRRSRWRPLRRPRGFRRAQSATGVEPETVGHDNVRSLAMALGAIESAEAGRRIEIVI